MTWKTSKQDLDKRQEKCREQQYFAVDMKERNALDIVGVVQTDSSGFK
jgi:hypothetical protein